MQSSGIKSLPDMDKTLQNLRNIKSKLFTKQDTSLHDLDIFEGDADYEIVKKIVHGEEKLESNSILSKAIASFIGAGLGDSLGSFTEFLPIDYTRNIVTGFDNVNELQTGTESEPFRNKPGQITDDTCQAMCLADSILANQFKFNSQDIRYRMILWWFHSYDTCRGNETALGLGANTKVSFQEFIKDPTLEFAKGSGKTGDVNGNGTVMRLAPVPIAYIDDLDACLDYAEKQSFSTHNGWEAAECCKLLSFITWHFFNEKTTDRKWYNDFLDNLEEKFKERTECPGVLALAAGKAEPEENMKLYNAKFNNGVQDRNWTWKEKDFKYSPTRAEDKPHYIGSYVMDATAMALHCVYHTNSYKEAILKTINMGGDADSVGAIVGMICGAIYGFDEIIQKWYVDYMVQWDKFKLAHRAYKMAQGALKRKQEKESEHKDG